MAVESIKKAISGGIGNAVYDFLHGRGEEEAMKKNFKKGDKAKKKGMMKKKPKKPTKSVRVKRKAMPKTKSAPAEEKKTMGRVRRKPSKYSKIKRATPTDKDYEFHNPGAIKRRRGEIKSLRDDYYKLEDSLRGMGKNPTPEQKTQFSRMKDSYFRKRKETLQSSDYKTKSGREPFSVKNKKKK